MKKNNYSLKTLLGLSTSCMMLFTMGMKAQCPSITTFTSSAANVCEGGNVQLTANAGNTLEYTVTNIPFAPIPTPSSGVTTLCNGGSETTSLDGGSLDDGGWIDQSLPFDFEFYGTTYSSFSVGTNGFIFLGAGAPVRGTGVSTYQGYYNAFPGTAAVAPCIAGLYADLNFEDGGTINYFTTGTAPNRTLVVNFDGGHFFDYPTGFITTQVLIYETSNVIEVHTTRSSGDLTAVEGIQDATATMADTVTGRNSEIWPVTTPDAYRFTPSGGTYTYSWSPATFLSATDINNPMANNITSSVDYTLTITGEGCSVDASITINEGLTLENTINVGPSDFVCVGTNVALSTLVTGGGEPYTYTWTGPDGFSSTDQNPVITNAPVSASGTYTAEIHDDCGNMSTFSADLTVNPSPNVTVSPSSASVCKGSDIAAALTASGATFYAWAPSDDGLDVTDGPDVNALPDGTTVYSVIGTDDNGCTALATVAVTVNEAPTVSATATPNPVCIGTAAQLQATASYSSMYQVTNIPFAFITSPGGDVVLGAGGEEVTSVTNGDLDDGDWEDQALPFTFNYFGTDYTSFTVSSNGFIALGGGSPNTYRGYGNTFPSTSSAHPSIGAVYADMDFNLGGLISYFVSGTAPNRVLVVNFIGQFYEGSGGYAVSQIQLYETSNVIELHIANSPADNDANEGIQNADGSVAYTIGGRNGAYWNVSMPDAFRFAPASSDSYTYAWTPEAMVVDPTIGDPLTQPLTTETDFSVVVAGTNGCTVSTDLPVPVAPIINFVAPVTPICAGSAPITLTATPTGGIFTGPGVDSLTGIFDPGTSGIGSIPVVYTVTVSTCTGSSSQNFDVVDCTGITENSFTQDVNMYPNPTTGTFSIEIPNANFSEMKISIIDPQGKEVYNAVDRNVNAGYKRQINLENLAKGIYFIKLSTDKGVKVKKLTLQ